MNKTSEKIKCTSCGAEFECGLRGPQPADEDLVDCWCMNLPKVMPVKGESCWCPECLEKKIPAQTKPS